MEHYTNRNYGQQNRGYHNRGYRNQRQNNRAYNQQQEKKVVKKTLDESDPDWKAKLTLPKADERQQTDDVTKTKGADFEGFGLPRRLLAGIFELGFEKPSPVQEESIPLICMGRSVLARAKNGTGKTGAFAIPSISRLSEEKDFTQLLVLLPTRELALQTAKVYKDLTTYFDYEIVTSTGGTDLKDDIIRLQRNVHIIIGTPGRLQDLAQQGILKIDQCKMVVLDEADKLLSADFIPAAEKLLEYTPEDRQLMLFSATFPKTIKSFKQKWLPNAATLNLMDSLTLKGISQYYAFCDESAKVRCLYSLFKKLQINQCIIFCNSVNRVELLCSTLSKLGFPTFYIHGHMGQRHRNRVFQNFRNGECRFLVCTDIFTRGIDVKNLNVVINFDFPRASNTYLHRIGRSGRFGHLGLAINFITNDDRLNLCKIEAELNTECQPVPKEGVPQKLYN